MTLPELTLAFAVQAPGLQTRKALGSSLMSLVETIGATRFACLYVRREGGVVVIERSISNVSRQWQQLYLDRGYDATDPVFQAVVRGGAYGFWSELTQPLTLGPEGREVMQAAKAFDMAEGFTKRVSLDNGGMAVTMVAGSDLERSDKAKAALRISLDIFANEGARMLKMGEDAGADGNGGRRDLSRTQLKVLMMRAEGLSNKAVAQAMGRHEKTVECHVTEILRRLEARNMIEAIRIATKRKLIL
jgi:LuxR family quorum sensing-dependent transcriptional regulator